MSTRWRWQRIALVFLSSLVLGSVICGYTFLAVGSGQKTSETATPDDPAAATSAPDSTATREIRPALTATPERPTPTPERPTPTPGPGYEVVYSSVNVRVGPGTEYEPLAFLYEGDVIVPLETNINSTWYRIELDDGTEGWVAASVVKAQGEAASASEAATPTASSPSGNY